MMPISESYANLRIANSNNITNEYYPQDADSKTRFLKLVPCGNGK